MNKLFYLIFFFVIFNCAGNSVNILNDRSNLDEAIELFNSEKYKKSKEAFESIIFANPGSYSAIESLYYLGECLFKLENYDKAIDAYSEFVMMSQNTELIEKSKYLICKCRYLLSSDYTKDQDDTKFTIEVIQNYLDENINSSYRKDSEEMIYQLRLKLAKKELETGKLYLRIEKSINSKMMILNLLPQIILKL